jgi:transposase
MARCPDVDLWFEDECHFQQHGSRCTMWVPPENKDPVLIHAPTRKSVAFFGAVRPSDGQLVTFKIDTFNTKSFGTFMRQLLRHRRPHRKIVLVLDNARWHHAAALRSWLRKHRCSIRLDFLPPYSPELNPIERVWKLTRRLSTHNQHFEQLSDLVSAVGEQLYSWRKPNETLQRLCAII